jgi:monofunctional biosynthetic peptidoglycan transglycosylase
MARRLRARSRRPKRKAGSAIRRRLRLAAAGLLALALATLAWEVATFPDVERLRSTHPEETAFMRYRRQQAGRAGRPWELRWTWVPLERISPHLQRAVVAAEDARFYQHRGFDARAIDRAMSDNLRQGRIVRGGSTITQQLAKNLYLSPRRSWLRKGPHFGLPASRLTAEQAAALAVALPNPLERDPAQPSPAMRRVMARVLSEMHRMESRERRSR